MDAFLGQITPTTAFAAGLLVYCLWRTFNQPSTLPDLPIIGYDQKEWFAWPRALFRCYFHYRTLYRDAYQEYSSKGQACIMPEPNDTKVVLPNSLSQWLCDQPDRVISAMMRQNDFLQTRYTFPIPKMAEHPYHMNVIKRDLTRKLAGLSEEIWDELDESFNMYWGTESEEWKEVNLMDTMIRIVTRTSNRLFVGKEACSNESYLSLCTSFAQDVPLSGIVIRMLPGFLQPLLAPIITLPNRYHTWRIRSLLRPEIERRLSLYESGKEAPNDFLQWFVAYAKNNLEAEESTPKYVADRIATINFAAIHTSTFSIVNAIIDIITSSEKDALLQVMTAEIQEVMADDEAEWTKTSVQRLVKTDSILRESMRYSTFMTGAIQRCVLAKEGVTTPDGLHLKYGTKVEVPGWPRHLDLDTLPDADKFIPLRFVEPPPSKENGPNGRPKPTGGLSVVDTSYDFLNFSHGRHACPGRFFAANELKLLLAYVSLHYEIEPAAVMEPKAIAFGSIMTPNPKLCARIKRKANK